MQKQNLAKLCYGLLLLFTFTSVSGQWAQITPSVDSLVTLTTPRPFSGVVLIAQEDKIRYAASRGLADPDRNIPVALHDQFIIGSVSKQFMAVLILRELDQGRLKLDDPLRKYLPELQPSWADTVTIHHLLSHTSGLVSLDKPLAFKPGTGFLYSPLLGFELLSKIAEKTSGKPYSELITTLFKKCRMKDSMIPALYHNGRMVSSYIEKSNGSKDLQTYPLSNMGSITPGGGIISTAKDLNRWNQHLHSGKLLSKSSYELMTTAFAKRPPHRWGSLGYGYGLQTSELNGKIEYSHSGAWGGFISTLIYYPQTRTSVVILENIAWDFDQPGRTFYVHDELRKLLNGGSAW